MNQQEYIKIKDNLVCPRCESTNIELYFTNIDEEDVDFAYVHAEMMHEDNTSQEIAHCCFCKDCEHNDTRDYFDEKLIKEAEEWLKKQRSEKSLDELACSNDINDIKIESEMQFQALDYAHKIKS